jgi:LuxR family transcriptional regulator, maltose regulon positive regulatory protein
VRSNAIERAELTDLLSSAPRRVALLSAPPGAGKTSLLAAWAVNCNPSVGWLTLDPYDNEQTRFWTYVIEAVRRTVPTFGDRPLSLLRAPGTSVAQEVLPALIDELFARWPDGDLVLDDYHQIRSVAIHEQVAYLVDHGPPGLRFAISTRADPPLPLPRWRANGALLELRMNDLRFTERETHELLTSRLGLSLEPRAVSLLQARTEGWPAGLHLAALSLRGRDDPEAFVERFAGTDRHLVDYLGDEVLSRLSHEVREFLVQTAILDRVSAQLCDAVLMCDQSEELLAHLEAANVFVVPLDERREWYRYHHLFGELLRQQLRRRDPAFVAGLHRRASDWFDASDAPADSVHHAIQSGDMTFAAERIATHWHRLVSEGLNSRVAGWLEMLPDDVLRGDARLCLAMAWTLFSLGRLDQMTPWIELVETAPLPAPFRDGTASQPAGAANLWASQLNVVGDMTSARRWADRALELEPPESPWRAIATLVLGNAQC